MLLALLYALYLFTTVFCVCILCILPSLSSKEEASYVNKFRDLY
jgi:hypothetical protein